MGSVQSKQDQSSKVFLPKTPTEFSNNLVSKLDGTIESDYTRSQYSEKYVQDRVNDELHKLEKESRNALEEALEKIPPPSSTSNEDSSDNLKEKLSTLKSQLESRPQKVDYPPELSKARHELVECLKDSRGKALNCYEQYEAFKTHVNNTLA